MKRTAMNKSRQAIASYTVHKDSCFALAALVAVSFEAVIQIAEYFVALQEGKVTRAPS